MLKHDGLRLSLGLLAHNEEQGIGQMLESLFNQSIFSEEGRRRIGIEHLQLVCVPNGCTDRTADVVAEIFAVRGGAAAIDLVVRPCTKAGKARAWNAYVHEFSNPRADYLILLDADISFASSDVLEVLIARLLAVPSALISTDTPIKDVKIRRERLSMRDRVSLSASEQSPQNDAICGQLYCARASELRRIWMPPALPVEDGFLAAMIYTDGFTVKQRPGAISRVVEAIHYYKAHEDMSGFLRHEKRIVVGSVINGWIFTLLWQKGSQGHVGRFIQQNNITDPKWLDDLIAHEVNKRGIWVVPTTFMLKRLRALKEQPAAIVVRRLPIAVVGTVFQLIACALANHTLRRSRASTFW